MLSPRHQAKSLGRRLARPFGENQSDKRGHESVCCSFEPRVHRRERDNPDTKMKKLANDIYCFDGEWIPCARTGRLLTGLPDSAPDAEVYKAMWKRAGATPEKPRPFLKLAASRVVSISAVHRHKNPDGTLALEIKSFPKVASPLILEREIIETFLESVACKGGQMVGFNSQSADLPLLIQRGIATRCHCPNFGRRPDKPWQGSDYFHRFSEAHFDLANFFTAGAGHGSAVMPSLHEIATASHLPGKLDLSGANVVDLWENGRFADITGYNETDACTTYLLWLRMVWFLGLITQRECKTEVTQFRTLLEREAQVRPHLARFLNAWQSVMDLGSRDKAGECPTIATVKARSIQPARKLITLITAGKPYTANGGRVLSNSSTRVIVIRRDQLDECTLSRLEKHLVPADGGKFYFCRMGYDPEGQLVAGKDHFGRFLLIPVHAADPEAVKMALNSHPIAAVDEWPTGDAA